MTTKKPSKRKTHASTFDKYELYVNSVQSAEHDAPLMLRIYKDGLGDKTKNKIILREDFCGTGALCFAWSKINSSHEAIGVDIDQSALDWGHSQYASTSKETVTKRVQMICADVMDFDGIPPDIICALNFSFYFIKKRCDLLRYFKSCRNRLKKNGILILDAFGGPEYLLPNIDRRRNSEKKFTFWWEVESFDAITHHIKTHLHFKPDGKRLKKNVFSYDWRLWTVPEITDALHQAGFKTIEYWAEGLSSKGYGNGKFRKIRSEKNCSTWVTYITAR